MDEELLNEKVEELENRVSYLEAELEMSYEQERFRRQMESMVRTEDADVEISDNQIGGYHALFTGLTADELNRVVESIEFRDVPYGWVITETSEGIGLEVWTGEY